MSRPIRLLLAGVLAAATCAATTATTAAASTPAPHTASPGTPRAIPGQYLITLDLGSDIDEVLDHFNIRPMFVYRTVTLGFAARLTEYQAQFLRHLPQVEAVEQDREIRIDTPQSSSATGEPRAAASWGLDRIDQRGLPLDGNYSPNHDGSPVTAYILDTGIQHNHPDFGGRASFGYDAMNDGRRGEDCNGHGTHVAGTVGSATYGVAKRVQLVSVRVLNCDGSGSYSGIIAGFDWVAANARKPAVLNASLGGPGSSQVDNAANALADSGVFLAVAGGNDSADACGYSPARAARAFTIGATTRNDSYASYSNKGKCIRLLAPGSEITSTWVGSGTRVLSGTSMASPHVAGVAALYKQANGDRSQGDVMYWMEQNGSGSRIGQVPANTPNNLLNLGGL
nr:S8 family peptidase [Kibdelosporangium sp. MJ126-NF4]CEL20204.1 Alkaline protease [Kibdelosporangium sp. MJ126-NF4]CTQ97430.1 Alkaline protease [Kibdelosporangium sp. MJ126-NF4]